MDITPKTKVGELLDTFPHLESVLMDEKSFNAACISEIPPEWFDEKRIVKRFDASPLINSGGSPMNGILHQANNLKQDEIFEVITPFIPAPIIHILTGKNFRVWCDIKDKRIKCYINKP